MIRKIVTGAIALVLAVIFAVSGYNVYLILNDRHTAEGVYEELNQFIKLSEDRTENGINSSKGEGDEENKTGMEGGSEVGTESSNSGQACRILFPEVDFEGLSEINPQVTGWIYCEGNTISFPVVQGEDNDYYLKHMFNGEVNPDGSIFLDSGNTSDFSDCHNIIYGHHMKSGAMFAPLLEYKKQEYYEEHPEMLLMTPDENYRVEIFAGYVADVEADAWQLEFASEEEFGEWIKRSIAKSWIASGIVPSSSDRILTLSTCSYEFDNARFVLLGVMRVQ